LIHHNFDADLGSPAASVRIEGNATNSWTSPSFSASFTPQWFASGTRRWPINPYVDLTAASGYTTSGFLFWSIVVEGNSQNLQLGQVWFGQTIRRFDPDLRWGGSYGARKPEIENRTNFEVDTTYSRGTTLWQAEATLDATDELAAAIEQHWYDVEGRSRPWLLIPNGPIADDRAYLVKYATTERQMQWNFEHYNQMRLAFQEKGRGLRPGT
jgi:hypothetical protein